MIFLLFFDYSCWSSLVPYTTLFRSRFWMNLGMDGFRCDAVPYLFEEEGTICENLPRTHEFLALLRRTLDKEFPGKMLLAEADRKSTRLNSSHLVISYAVFCLKRKRH